MKTSAEKSTTTTSTTATQAANQPFFARAGGGDFFAASTQTSTPAVQMKMTVSKPGDKFEREADTMADKVMRMPDRTPVTPEPGGPPQISRLQRKCTECEEEEVQRQAMEGEMEEEEEGSLQAKEAAGQAAEVTSGVQAQIDGLRGGGEPLSESVRAFFEPRFGRDFSQVRVHTGVQAAAAAHSINALAYTIGNYIVFGAGQFAPETPAGRRLLAHELTHVRQNARGAAGPPVQRYEGPEHQDLGDADLQELLQFLQTEEGASWAQNIGMDRDQLVAQITRDPQRQGGLIRLRNEVDPATGKVAPVELTPGQIIALMGDFYESWERLAAAPAAEIRGILQVMQGERTGAVTASEAELSYEQITGGRYLRLAQRNDTHFARENKREWRRLHEQAIAEAQAAREESSEVRLQRALLIDAAAGHFLTDAFAAGHLFDKSEALDAITLYLASHPMTTTNPYLQTYAGIVTFAGRMSQLVLKNIHDRMNREGFLTANARGMRWRTFGDDHLASAQETQRVAALAVFLSRQQVRSAHSGARPDPAEVEALMPDDDTVQRATQQAIAYIQAAAQEVEGLIYRNRGLAPTQFGTVLGGIIESNLSAVGHPGREREITEMTERMRRLGQEGVIAPSFTVFEWR
jgi:hypothetical protein